MRYESLTPHLFQRISVCVRVITLNAMATATVTNITVV